MMSITTIPPTRCSIIQSETGVGYIKYVPTPSLLPFEILVKTVAVAINPTDHKMPAAFPSPGAIIGCDFAGTITKLGDDVSSISRLRVGDRVAGSVHGSNPMDPADGAFSEYIKTSADLVFPLRDSMSWETAAAIGGTGHGSLCLALKDVMGLVGTPIESTQDSEYVLVYVGWISQYFIRRVDAEKQYKGRQHRNRYYGSSDFEAVSVHSKKAVIPMITPE
jgi:NADPH:quinone reductase-like Zn-dependent oxidoreductase